MPLVGTTSELMDKLNKLNQSTWIDERTRAVVVEFAVYNPFVNLFLYTRLLFEFPASSGILPTAFIYPMKLLPYESGFGLLLVICETVLCFYIIVFIVKEVRKILKHGFCLYIGQFWNWIEICIIIMALLTIIIFVIVRIKTNQVLSIFNKSHGNSYINLAEIANWDSTYNTLLAFIIFFATAKFTKLLRFNRRIAALNAAFKMIGE